MSDTFLMLCSPNLRRSLFLPLVEPSIFSLIDREPLTERERRVFLDMTGKLGRSIAPLSSDPSLSHSIATGASMGLGGRVRRGIKRKGAV